MKHTKEEIEWRMSHDAYEQLKIVHNWADYENYSCFDDIYTMEELIELYIFIIFDVGVEFVGDVYMLIADEDGDGDTTTEDLCKEFNEYIGIKYWKV